MGGEQRHCPFTSQSPPRTSLKWTDSIVDWVELLYSLYEAGSINNGKISLKELFRIMGEMFDLEVNEFANHFMNIKSRADNKRTKYMDKLKNLLLQKMEEADRKPSRK
jgi:hypothetical protein